VSRLRLILVFFGLAVAVQGAHQPPLSPPHKVRSHWAFQPVKRPHLPSVKQADWVRMPIDRFALARLEAQGWTPSPRADRRTLIRRAFMDLTGLMPPIAEVWAFVADDSPNAWAKLIDRLLASPHYGERWGRHWLDVARYADNKGYVGVGVDRRYPYSYTYRDYVVRSFNEDLPFNRFIIEQIAADHLKLGEDKRPLAALGFLTLGRRFLNRKDDIIDDRIDVVTRGFMGLTVTCARCHDHKYDPIPTADYYSLHGVFRSSEEPKDLPLLGGKSLPPQHDAYLREKKRREEAIQKLIDDTYAKGLASLRRRGGEYMLAVHTASVGGIHGAALNRMLTREKLNPIAFQNWKRSLAQWQKANHPVFMPWFEQKGAANPLAQKSPERKKQSEIYSKLFTETEHLWNELRKKNPQARSFADPNREAVRQILFGPNTPATVPKHLSEGDSKSLLFGARSRIRTLRSNLGKLAATHPGAPPRAHVLIDRSRPVQPYIYLRGSRHLRGPSVPRRFLEHFAIDRKPFVKGSGRIELAQAIADPKNPLTARVIVNRVWAHHFGRGLVETPSDFGMRADPPTHPKLLDWLAAEFVANGWSIKKMHRQIMLSAVFQQAANDRAGYRATDPENQLLWKMNRQRVSFEALRDTVLQASGQLVREIGGQPVKIIQHPTVPRRTLYGFIDRQNLPSVFRTFDFANPDAHCPDRFTNTVPQQALFLMNSPFMLSQSRKLVGRAAFSALENDGQKTMFLYRTIFQREPKPIELREAAEYVGANGKDSWALLAQVLLLSNEFRYLD